MSFKCKVCGKGPKSGKTVSHSHRATNRWFRPNLQRIKFVYEGKTQRGYVCTTCISSDRITKAM